MNSTDFQTLLTAPPVSRTTFLTRLLSDPSTQHEKPFEDLFADSANEPVTPLPGLDQSTPPDFPV